MKRKRKANAITSLKFHTAELITIYMLLTHGAIRNSKEIVFSCFDMYIHKYVFKYKLFLAGRLFLFSSFNACIS